MKRRHLLGLSTTVGALAVVTVATAASPAGAHTTSCRTTLSGGLVGNEVIASSSDVYAEAVAAPQRISVDEVTVNDFGQRRYRLAAPIKLITAHGPASTTFRGGVGYFVMEEHVGMTRAFIACSRTIGA